MFWSFYYYGCPVRKKAQHENWKCFLPIEKYHWSFWEEKIPFHFLPFLTIRENSYLLYIINRKIDSVRNIKIYRNCLLALKVVKYKMYIYWLPIVHSKEIYQKTYDFKTIIVISVRVWGTHNFFHDLQHFIIN